MGNALVNNIMQKNPAETRLEDKYTKLFGKLLNIVPCTHIKYHEKFFLRYSCSTAF